MIFSINIPVKIISGRGCLLANQQELLLGKRAMIVTGNAGAKSSGALADVCKVLDDNKITYSVVSAIPANPPLLEAYNTGKQAADFNADFIIGIGGG